MQTVGDSHDDDPPFTVVGAPVFPLERRPV
jgi:hypothetical protein